MNKEIRPGVFVSDNKIKQLKCMDCCRDNPGFFFVKKEVWKEAGFENYLDGIICLSCFVKRLNRQITLEDFDDNGSCSNDALIFMYNYDK